MPAKPTTRTVSTVKTMFEIIRILQDNGGANVADISDSMDLAKSTIYDHLSTLEEEGYVQKEDTEYNLGLKFLDHGMYARETYQELITTARPIMESLAEETKEVVWIMVEENGWAVYLDFAKGEHAVPTTVRKGSRRHLHWLSAGKAILAHKPRHEVNTIIDERGLPRRTPYTITDRDELFDEFEKIREEGFAKNDEEAIEGIRAVGAPIITEDVVRGAISVTAPINRLNGERYRVEFPNLVQGAAKEIELNILYQPI